MMLVSVLFTRYILELRYKHVNWFFYLATQNYNSIVKGTKNKEMKGLTKTWLY